MLYFDRVCKVVIDNRIRTEIENCKIKFEIVKSYRAKDNVAKIEIFNLAPDTRNLISDHDSLVTIYAGHRLNTGLVAIGSGDVSKIQHNRDKTEVVTEMYLAEGIKRVRTKPISFGFAFSSNPSLPMILKEITKQTGIAFKSLEVDEAKIVSMGYSDAGSFDHVMDNLALEFNFSWSIQNGLCIIKGTNAVSRREVLVLNPQTGLILHPESVKKVSKRLIKSEITKLGKKARMVQCLLQPKLQIHDVVKVESQDIKGLFEVQKITHVGDTRGNDWYSNLEINPLGEGEGDLTPTYSQTTVDRLAISRALDF